MGTIDKVRKSGADFLRRQPPQVEWSMFVRFQLLIWMLIVWAIGVEKPTHGASFQDDDRDEMKIMEQIVELEHQLAAASEDERNQAEQALIALGPAALRHLRTPDDSMTSDQRGRLARIRLALEKKQVELLTFPSRVTFKGELTLPQILALIQRQTSNEVVLMPHADPQWTESKRPVEFQDVPFWEALDQVQREFGLELDRFRGGRNRLQLKPARQSFLDPIDDPTGEFSYAPPIAYSGLMRLAVNRIDVVRHFRNPHANRTLCTLGITWEPRLMPLAIDLPLSSIQVIDELERVVKLENPGRVSVMVEPGMAELEFSVPLPLFDRQIEMLHSLSGRLEVVVAGTAETFEFPDIAHLTPGHALKRADATVTFEEYRKNEDLFEIAIFLTYEEENNALESHRAWAFDNTIYLRGPDGEKITPIGLETYQQSNSGLGVRYLFIQVPDDAALIYCTPAAVVKMELPFELTQIRLP